MGYDLISRINSQLRKFRERIVELDNNFDKIEIHGRYQTRAPLINKNMALLLIKYLKEAGVDLSELKREYDEINEKFHTFEKKRGKVYRKKLYEELKYFVNNYHRTITTFLELDPVGLETENDMDGRDIIEMLLEELKDDYDLHDMRVKVSALDEVLKSKFKLEINTILDECPGIERPEFPESFWWRHPSKFLKKTA